MSDKPHPEMGYQGCLGIIRLAQKYYTPRVQAAAERALLSGALPLQKRRIDSEELVGPASIAGIVAAAVMHASRQRRRPG